MLFAVLGAEGDAVLAADADIDLGVLDRPGIGPNHFTIFSGSVQAA